MSSDGTGWPNDQEFLATLRVRLFEYAAYKGVRGRADDVVQETMLTLLEKYGELPTRPDVVRVAYTICRYKVLESFHGRQHEPLPDHLPVADPTPSIDASLAEAQVRARDQRRVRAALQELCERCRQLFKLRLQMRQTDEIARIMGAAESTVYVWEHRCRKRMLAALHRIDQAEVASRG